MKKETWNIIYAVIALIVFFAIGYFVGVSTQSAKDADKALDKATGAVIDKLDEITAPTPAVVVPEPESEGEVTNENEETDDTGAEPVAPDDDGG